MPKKAQMELLKKMLQDSRTWIALGKITRVFAPDSNDRKFLRVRVERWPELIEINATMSWDSVGAESGIFDFPAENDLVLLAFADGDDDEAFVIRRLTSKHDKIPIQAVDGSLCLKSREGKAVKIVSGEKVSLQRSDNEGVAEQPLVLGEVFKEMMSTVLDAIANHEHNYIDSVGQSATPVIRTSEPPINAGDFSGEKASPVDDGSILSDLSFTEK